VIFGCRGTIGNVMYSYDECFVLNTAMYINCTKYSIGKIYFAIKEINGFKSKITGAVQPQITINDIKKEKLKIINDNRLNQILNTINNIEKENIKLNNLKQLYLKKFFGF
jgi:hypothetical protein